MKLKFIKNYFILALILGFAFVQGPLVSASDVVPEIVLEVNAVQIILNDEHRDGVDWEAIVADFHAVQLKKEDAPSWIDKKHVISVGNVSNEDYAVLLDALDTVGLMSQVTQPSVALTSLTHQNVVIVASIAKKVGNIRLDLVLRNSSKGPKLSLDSFVGVLLKDSGKPVASTLRAHTEMDLKDGSTIVLGSITSEEEITKMHKVPLLGDLPIVGLVFRKQGRLMQKIETVLFLTPRFKAVVVDDHS